MRRIGPRRDPTGDIQRELASHVEERVDDLVRSGHSRAAAEAIAREEFGDPTLTRVALEALAGRRRRRQRLSAFVDSVVQDFRIAVRGLGRQPGFTALALLALVLGIGSTTAIFSVVYGVLLRPLNYRDPGQLVTLWAAPRDAGVNGSPSYPDFRDWREQSASFATMAFLRGTGMTVLDAQRGAQQLTVAEVSGDFVTTLGARPVMGSLAALASDGPEAVVVLKHAVWQARFGGDSTIVGRTLDFTDGSYRVIGVMEPGVDYPLWADLYTPLTQARIEHRGLEARDYRLDNRVLARLRPRTSLADATAEMETIAARLAMEYPATNRDWGIGLLPLDELLVGNVRTSLYVLLAGVGGLLLIASVNVANLCLARTLIRGREMGVRASLGAGRGRLVRQLLTESLVLAMVGGALGILMARWGVALFLAWGVPGLPRTTEITVDARVLAFATAISAASAFLFGLTPAVVGSRIDLVAALKGHAVIRTSEHLRSGLVGVQVAVTVVLLAATGLLAKSFTTLQNVEPGFAVDGLVTLQINPPAEFEGHPAARMALYDRIVEAAQQHPAFAGASIVNHLPLAGRGVITPLRVEGFADDVRISAWLRLPGPSYFDLLGLPIVAGRGFDARDHQAWAGAVLVSESLARQLFNDGEPLGQRITLFKQSSGDPDFGDAVHGEIVGVVADTRNTLRELQPTPAVYLPLSEHPWPNAMLVVRPRPEVQAGGDALRDLVRTIEPRIPVTDVRRLDELATVFVGRDRFLAVFAAAFATVAAGLALVGVYGVMAFAVRRRARDLGIRMALGATRRRVTLYVMEHAALVIGTGTLLGLAGTFVVTRFMRSILFQTDPLDVPVVASAAAAMIVLGVFGAWMPARRAARTNPVRILRSE